MNTAIQTITASLEEVFAPMDLEVLEATKVWAKARAEAIQAFKNSDEGRAIIRKPMGSYEYYARLFAIAGGKGWYGQLQYGYSAAAEAFVVKNADAIAKKRNATITAKLIKAGVSKVLSTTYTRTSDGFDGTFTVQTDAGQKTVNVNTIRAGGYNIQCLHLRVLTKIW
jgi:hypothetical protein